MALPHAIQVEVFRYCPENEPLSKFTDVCQMLKQDLIEMSTAVDCCLFGSRSKCKVFKGIQFLCAACPAGDPHYILTTKQTGGLDVNCDRDDKYRQLTTKEALWFFSKKDKEITKQLKDREFLQISQKIPDQDSLFRLAAVLNMTSELKHIQTDDSKRNLAGFNLLYDWQNAKDGYRSQLIEALKKSNLLKLAQMVQQCEYDPEKLTVESDDDHSSFDSSFHEAETFVNGASPPTIQPVEISDNDLLRCACYINERDISKLIRALDNDNLLNFRSIMQDDDDAQMKAYSILRKYMQAHPDTTKDSLQEKLKLLGFSKAAKNLSPNSCVIS